MAVAGARSAASSVLLASWPVAGMAVGLERVRERGRREEAPSITDTPPVSWREGSLRSGELGAGGPRVPPRGATVD